MIPFSPHIRASISSDQNPVYECLAPITARVWVARVGFEPLITLVGYEEEWRALKRSSFVLDELERWDFDVAFVPTPEGYRSANVAQIARIYACGDDRLLPADVAITADIDMWPVDRDWFCRYLPDPGTVTTYYGNFPSRYPMCYVAAAAADWRTLVGNAVKLPVGGTEVDATIYAASAMHVAVRNHMLTHLRPDTAPADAWQHDEEWLTARIKEHFPPERVTHVIRPSGDPFPDRIDRVNWPTSYDLEPYRDAHVLRPSYGNAQWSQLSRLLGKLCPKLVGWADEYMERYRRYLSEDPKQ